jgi:hypothetical protein
MTSQTLKLIMVILAAGYLADQSDHVMLQTLIMWTAILLWGQFNVPKITK